MRVSTYQNRKGEDRVGLQGTLGELVELAKVVPDAKLALTFSPEQAKALVAKVNGDIRKAFDDAGVKPARAPKV